MMMRPRGEQRARVKRQLTKLFRKTAYDVQGRQGGVCFTVTQVSGT